MKVQVLGTGCQRCDTLYQNTVEAVKRVESVGAVAVEKVSDPEVFFRLKVHVTPALVIDETVISTGKSISVDEIESEIRKHCSGADK